MKDCFNREIKAGDIVAYASESNLNVGQVIGPCRSNPSKIRVSVFQSNSYRFLYGHKDWRTGEYKVKPKTPVVVTIGMPSRVIIVDAAPPVPSETS